MIDHSYLATARDTLAVVATQHVIRRLVDGLRAHSVRVTAVVITAPRVLLRCEAAKGVHALVSPRLALVGAQGTVRRPCTRRLAMSSDVAVLRATRRCDERKRRAIMNSRNCVRS